MGAVLQFPTEAVQSSFVDAWAAIPSTMKTRSLSRAKLKPIWDAAAKRVGGQDVLLGALKAYLKGDKDLPKSGGPALDRWLKNEKYDHWLEGENSVVSDASQNGYGPTKTITFPDKRVRDAVLASQGLPFVVSYLDQCQLVDSPLGPLLQPKTDYARRKLLEHAGLFKSLGLYGIRMGV